jgi:hypothetical protein
MMIKGWLVITHSQLVALCQLHSLWHQEKNSLSMKDHSLRRYYSLNGVVVESRRVVSLGFVFLILLV